MKLHLPVILRKAVLACLAAVGMTLMPGLPAYAGWSDQDADTFLYTGETTIDLTTSDVTQAYYLIRPGAAASANDAVSGVVELLNVGNGVEVKVSDGYYSDAQGKNFTTDFIINELRYAGGNGNNTFSIHNKQSATIKKFSGAPADIKMYDAQELVLGGDAGTAHTVDIISFEANNNQNVYTRNLTIADGVSVTATKLLNAWGFGTLKVDGILNITDTTEGLFLLSGENASTQNNRITGSGIINTATLICDNQGTYNFDIDELNVQGNAVFGGYGVHVHGGSINLAGSTTMNTLVTLYDGAIIQNNAASAIQFGSDFTLDIKNLTAQVQDDRSRVYTILSGTGNKDLSALNIDKVNVSERYGWNWSFNQDGTIVAEYKGRDISFDGGDLNWSTAVENTAFSMDGTATCFQKDDNVTILNDSKVALAEDIAVTRLIVQDDSWVNLETAGHDLLIESLQGKGFIQVNNTGADESVCNIHGEGASFSGTVKVKGNTTLYVRSSLFIPGENPNASIIISDGAALGSNWNFDAWFNNDSLNVTTQGTGVVRLMDIGLQTYHLRQNRELNRSYEIHRNTILNGYWSNNGSWYQGNKHTYLRVGTGRLLSFHKGLTIQSAADLQITGGRLSAGSITLGSSSNKLDYWGALTMTDGWMTTGTINFQCNHSNRIDLSGGNVEFTGSQVVNRGYNTDATIRIVGRDAQHMVNLHATQCSWTLDGAGLSTKPVIGNVTVNAGNTHGITLANVALTGSVVNNATLLLSEGISVASGSTATLSGDTVEIARTIANSGTLNLNTALVEVSQRNAEKLAVDLENAEVWYSADGSENGASREGNGFRFLKKCKLYLATGGNVFIAQGAQVQLDNQRYDLFTDDSGIAFIASEMTRSREYYVNTGEITVGGDEATVGTSSAESFVVAQGCALNLAGSTENHSVNDLLTLISGAGDVVLKTSAQLVDDSATVATGKLYIGESGTLKIGFNVARSASVASFSTVEIDGGTIYYNNDSTTINNLTIKEGGATWNHANQEHGLVTLADTTTLEGNISFVAQWNGQYAMEKLVGSGNLSISRQKGYDEAWSLRIDDATGYTGTLSFTKAQVTLGSSLGAGAHISVGEGGSLILSGGNTVQFQGSESERGASIELYSSTTCELSNNTSLVFCNNSATVDGGAIYTLGSLSIRNNDSVLFEKNVEKSGSTYRLRSVYMTGGCALSLSAASGKNIEFYDSVYVGSGTTVNLNETYTYQDAEGQSVAVEQTGDIIFTGATTVNDLYKAKGDVDGSDTEILNSRTTEVLAMTNLYGGRLRVEDGAIYQGRGIMVHEGSAATVLVKDATLNHDGFALTFNAGTTLQVEGESLIVGDVLMLAQSVLHLEGETTINGALTLGLGMQLAGDILAEVQNLQVGQSITLVSGLESLAVQTQNLMRSVEYTTVVDGYEVQASEYFSNLAGNTGLVMRYDGEAGTVSITQTMAVPEPTTATLSLFALAALAARRRRK